MPVVFLHGGPGRRRQPGPSPLLRSRPHIIIFDQRGAGRSKPLGEITDNTTLHLVADIERLRSHLASTAGMVFGGSWGSTLALAYAEAHADRCKSLVLRGIFLCRKRRSTGSCYGMRCASRRRSGANSRDYLPEAERGDLLKAYYTPPERSRPRGPHAGGAQMERL